MVPCVTLLCNRQHFVVHFESLAMYRFEISFCESCMWIKNNFPWSWNILIYAYNNIKLKFPGMNVNLKRNFSMASHEHPIIKVFTIWMRFSHQHNSMSSFSMLVMMRKKLRMKKKFLYPSIHSFIWFICCNTRK